MKYERSLSEDSDALLILDNDSMEEIPHTPEYKTKFRSLILLTQFIKSVPAIAILLVFNLLDSLSYGMIIFSPLLPVQAFYGISMYLWSTILSQFVLSLISRFQHGVTCSMMVEVIPLYHSVATKIIQYYASFPERSNEIVPTVMFIYALSTLLTSIAFFALGFAKCGKFINYFPRHILLGIIGGIGLFLLKVAIDILCRNGKIIEYFNVGSIGKVCITLFLATLLRVILTRFKQSFVLPLYFLVVTGLFYASALPFFSIKALREKGLLFSFDRLENEGNGFLKLFSYYNLFSFDKINFVVLPTVGLDILAMVLLNTLHVPINVPSFSISTEQKMDLDVEFISHGVSNFITTFVGCTPNYFVYSNSVLFYRIGARSRLTGVILATLTVLAVVYGELLLNYVPKLLIGTLIAHISIDLIKEGIYDSRKVTHRFEYIIICLIMTSMMLVGFLEGIMLGLFITLLYFVIMYNSTTRDADFKVITDLYDVGSKGIHPHSEAFMKSCYNSFVRMVDYPSASILYYGNIDKLITVLSRCIEGAAIRFVVVNHFDNLKFIDYSAAFALNECILKLQLQGYQIIFISQSEKVLKYLDTSFGLTCIKDVSNVNEFSLTSFDPIVFHSLNECKNFLELFFTSYSILEQYQQTSKICMYKVI
jgi:SulP family sulfate permease